MTDASPSPAADGSDRFVSLFTAAHPRVYGFILSLLPDRAQADEVMQETSLVLWRRFEEFDADRDFVRWACGVAINLVRKHRRERARRPVPFGDDTLERIVSARQQHADLLETRRRLLGECIAKLSESDRKLIQTCYEPATTFKQAAERLGRPANTVYKAIKRIRLALFECVDRRLRTEERPA